MSEVPKQEAGTATFGVRRLCQGNVVLKFQTRGRRLRIVRRPKRPGRVLARRHELTPAQPFLSIIRRARPRSLLTCSSALEPHARDPRFFKQTFETLAR